MKFCNIAVESPFFLSPMASVTNLPFRVLCRQYGAGMVFTEQVNATQIARMHGISGKSIEALRTCNEEKPVAAQLFGVSENDFAEAVAAVQKNFDLININAGCPSHKEVSIGAGAALLKNPEKICGIVEACKSAASKPVTVKMRLGWKKNDSVKIAKMLENAGADALIVHGRTALQGYSGMANWKAIGKAVSAVSIPVVANGDIASGTSAKKILEQTGCKFGMVGRQAMTNPLIFREINEYFRNGVARKALQKEKIRVFFDYFELCKRFGMVRPEDLRLNVMRLTRGIAGAKKIRVKVMNAKTVEDIIPELESFFRQTE